MQVFLLAKYLGMEFLIGRVYVRIFNLLDLTKLFFKIVNLCEPGRQANTKHQNIIKHLCVY